MNAGELLVQRQTDTHIGSFPLLILQYVRKKSKFLIPLEYIEQLAIFYGKQWWMLHLKKLKNERHLQNFHLHNSSNVKPIQNKTQKHTKIDTTCNMTFICTSILFSFIKQNIKHSFEDKLLLSL